jgi:polyketide synthase PksN
MGRRNGPQRAENGHKAPVFQENDSGVHPVSKVDTSLAQLQAELANSLAAALFLDPSEIQMRTGFIDIGLDSVVGVQWVQAINKTYGTNITATKIYDYPSILQFSQYLHEELQNGTPKNGTAHKSLSFDQILRNVQSGILDADHAAQLLEEIG